MGELKTVVITGGVFFILCAVIGLAKAGIPSKVGQFVIFSVLGLQSLLFHRRFYTNEAVITFNEQG